MAITVHEVPKWLVIDGIGHAVSCIISGWHHTACGTITPNGKTEDTLPARVNAAKAGETIEIAAGTYQEALAIDKALTLRSEKPDTCVLDVTEDAPAISVSAKEPVTIEGLTIRWQLATSDGKAGPGCAVLAKDARVTLKNCRIVAAGTLWRYFKGTQAPPATWRNLGFVEDASWLTGPTGIGYGDGDDNTILDDMRQIADDPGTPENEAQPGYMSVFLRKTFTVDDPSAITSLIFRVAYDDGFVAYLNGTEIGRRGLTGNPPAYNAAAAH